MSGQIMSKHQFCNLILSPATLLPFIIHISYSDKVTCTNKQTNNHVDNYKSTKKKNAGGSRLCCVKIHKLRLHSYYLKTMIWDSLLALCLFVTRCVGVGHCTYYASIMVLCIQGWYRVYNIFTKYLQRNFLQKFRISMKVKLSA